MKPRPATLRGIATAVPAHPFTQERTCEALVEALSLDRGAARRARAVYRRSRIRRRHSVLSDREHPLSLFGEARGIGTAERMELYGRHAPALAAEACRRLLTDPSLPPRSTIDHVLVASCTGFLAPGLDVRLVRALELRPDVGRTLIGFQGCQAGLSALRVADSIARAQPRSCVLICCVELSTLHLQLAAGDDDLLAGSLFADGAAAALVAGPDLPLRDPAWAIEDTTTRLHPDSESDMTWAVGDEGFRLHLSRLLPRRIGRELAPSLAGWLGEGSSGTDRFWAVHPGGATILDELESALGLPTEALAASREVLAGHGNMSSATIWFVLDALRRASIPERGVALAFGPGLTVEGARLRRVAP